MLDVSFGVIDGIFSTMEVRHCQGDVAYDEWQNVASVRNKNHVCMKIKI